MKTLILLAAASIFTSGTIFAQASSAPSGATAQAASQAIPKGNGKISGVVSDEAAKTPVEFATVALIDKLTNKTVDGAITDDKGKFTISRVANGQYSLTITFLGYEAKSINNIAVEGKDEVNIGPIALKANTKTLNEVAVLGEKPLVEDKVDRMVYNAEKDITNTGGTASDVLKKVPGLTVDLEGNVQLRGSGNIRVLINNKPSTIMATNIADALRQIPSDQIKTVEVITSPSAKYDAEGTAGIINIITKKNGLQGVNGTVNASYGTRNSNVNGNVNYRKGKFGINSSLGTNWNNNPGKQTGNTYYTGLSNIDRLYQTMEGKRVGNFNFLQFGTDYDLTPKSNLAAGIRMQSGNFAFKTTQTSSQYLQNALIGLNTRQNNIEFENMNYDVNLDYNRQFSKQGQELTVLGLLSRNNRDNYNYADVYNRDNQLTLQEQNLNDAYNEEKTLQVDYTQPLAKDQLLEIGGKAILRYAESDYRFLLADPTTGDYVIQPNRTDIFSYHQDVAAAYASYGFSLNKKYNFKLGTRYEHTQISGDFTSTETTINQDYDNFIPSISISRTLKNNQTVKFNYTKRIQRPQLYYLNPFENRTDTFNIQVGNPNLEAELTNSYELGYSRFFKSGTSFNASVYWRQTNNSIQSFTLPTAEGVNYTRFGNIGRNASYGFSLFGNTKFLKKGNISGNVNVFYTDLESRSAQLEASNASVMYNANLNASYTFNKGISAQVFGMFNSPRLTLQGKSSSWTYYNLALKKELLNKKASISAGVDNPFSQTLKMRNTFKTNTSEQDNLLYVYTRQFRISANYQFGKMDFKNQPRRKKKISNDDAKAGESN
ncbi:MAG: TonB-dependent receptor domain-containing protein [Adhaeribacter sp.]